MCSARTCVSGMAIGWYESNVCVGLRNAKIPSLVRTLFCVLAAATICANASLTVAQTVQISVDISKSGPTISRNVFGQFAEHLGHGIYEGIWVGPDSTIPNTRGIRNDVVAALKALKVPN
ncbi:MAG TPA: hypothetical protein VGI13_02640, partial [Candidatus Acidoferrum sp.]